MSLLEEKKKKHPKIKLNYNPKEDCKFCNGTGINKKDGFCICLFVQHDFCEEAGYMISDFAKKELELLRKNKI